jgi:uncharacterized phiE125 gp8 family phage protein
MFKKNTSVVIESLPQKLWNLEDVKNYLRISHNYDDSLIVNLIDAAIVAAENFTGLTLILKLVHFISNKKQQSFVIKYKPINIIKKVIIEYERDKYELKQDEYYIDCDNHLFYLKKPLSNGELLVEYMAGFDEHNIPKSIRHGILLHISEMYDRQEQPSGYVFSSDIKNLYSPYRQLKI